MFPASLTEEEQQLKQMFETLKRVKKLVQTLKAQQPATAKGDGDGSKVAQKRSLNEIAGVTEEVKRLVKAGAMTIAKVEEKQTFKRSKQLDRRLKEGDREPSVKYQPFSSAAYSGNSDYYDETSVPARSNVSGRYDNFVSGGEFSGGAKGHFGEAQLQRGTTIYVRGYDLMEEPLRKTFADYGRIIRIHVEDRRRSAFIEFGSTGEADRAIREMNGNMMNGITLRVTMARRQNYVPRSNFGGGGESDDWSNRRQRDGQADSWSSIASGRGRRDADKADQSSNRDIVTYDDADSF